MMKRYAGRTARLTPVLRALADPTRLGILFTLEGRTRTVGDIVGRFALAQPTITRHLQALTVAGLVVRRKEGARVLYSLHAARLGRACRDLAAAFACCRPTPNRRSAGRRKRPGRVPPAKKAVATTARRRHHGLGATRGRARAGATGRRRAGRRVLGTRPGRR
jgi:DNA-binding transcriptional ArsR family regulator